VFELCHPSETAAQNVALRFGLISDLFLLKDQYKKRIPKDRNRIKRYIKRTILDFINANFIFKTHL